MLNNLLKVTARRAEIQFQISVGALTVTSSSAQAAKHQLNWRAVLRPQGHRLHHMGTRGFLGLRLKLQMI